MAGIKCFKLGRFSKECRQDFIFNIFLGIMFMVLFLALENTTIRQDVINRWFDLYIKLRMNGDSDAKNASRELIFLDLDDKSLRDLGRPSMTPRNKIADLLNFAYQGGAKVVILDMDFSEIDYTPEQFLVGDTMLMSGLARDQILFDLLKQIRDDGLSETKVLLPITTYADKAQKNNIFLSLIDNKKIYATTPSFTVSSRDNSSVRFWMPYLETIKGNDRKQEVLWSIPLLSMVLMLGDFEELDQIENSISKGDIDSFALHLKRGNQKYDFIFHREKLKNHGLIRDSQNLQYNRIQYTLLPPHAIASNPVGNIAASRIGHWRKNGLDNKRIDYKDKIVIIGRADQDCADIYATPIGRIPGMYVHGNSIATILGKSRPRLTPIYKYIIIELMLIIIASLIFLCANPFLAKCLIVQHFPSLCS